MTKTATWIHDVLIDDREYGILQSVYELHPPYNDVAGYVFVSAAIDNVLVGPANSTLNGVPPGRDLFKFGGSDFVRSKTITGTLELQIYLLTEKMGYTVYHPEVDNGNPKA